MRRMVLLLFLLNALLVALMVPGSASVPWIAAEGLVLAGLVLWLPAHGLRRGLAWSAGVLYGLSALFVLADAVIRASLGRPLNLYLDTSIAHASVDLLTANLGLGMSLLLAALVTALVLVLAAVVAGLLLRIGEYGHRTVRHRLTAGLAMLALLGLWLPAQLVSATAVRIGAAQADQMMAAQQAGARFREQVATVASEGGAVALGRLADTHVILAFVESYGVSAIADERYRPVVSAALDRLEQAIDRQGLHVVSGRLRSPVQGGQSWLAHGTLLSGLWLDSQQDYDALLATGRTTLIDDFRATGHQAVAVMPGITMAWPEGRALGYDRILDARNLGYRGPPLNWVTMPDQFTWSRMHDTVLAPASAPVFAELALISSHAPWVPVLPVLEQWHAIGRGEVFETWRDAGEAPASLWQDPERVRAQYARAVAYSLDVAAGYIDHRLPLGALLVILGDHQPAPLVTGEGASRDVPVHLISADRTLLEPFSGEGNAEAGLAGFRPGLFPGEAPGPDMSAFRPFLHRHLR